MKVRPLSWPRVSRPHRNYPIDSVQPVFYIHPSTSQLAEQLVIDPQSLKDENYSGIYDASGDYVPQYCDNPDEIPQGAPMVNPSTTPGTVPGVAQAGDNDNPPKPVSTPSEGDNK